MILKNLLHLKSNDRGGGPKEPAARTRQEPYNEDLSESKHKSKSLQYEKNNVNFSEPVSSHGDYLRKKSEKKNLQLQEAYKPILPNDIYKNYYGGKLPRTRRPSWIL